MKKCKILAWNPHSLKPKVSEINHFLSQSPHDILLFSETWLSDSNIFINGFNVYQMNRAHGGVALFIKSGIPHSELRTISTDYAEAVSIKVEDPVNPFTIAVLYCSPSASRAQAQSFFMKVLSLPGPIVISGDFNAKHQAWNNTKFDRKGLDLFKLSQTKNFVIHPPDGPTLIPVNGGQPSIVDFVLSRDVLGVSNPVVFNDLSSDHLPISFEILSSQVLDENLPYNYKKANWRKFSNILSFRSCQTDRNFPELNSRDLIDKCVEELTDNFKSAISVSVPKRKINPLKNPYSEEIKVLISTRNRYRNIFKSTRDPHFKSAMNQMNRMIRRKTAEENRLRFEAELAALDVSDHSLFRKTKMLKKKKGAVPPLLRPSGSYAYSDTDKARAFADAFKEAHDLTRSTPSPHEREVARSLEILRKIKASNDDPRGQESRADQCSQNIDLSQITTTRTNGAASANNRMHTEPVSPRAGDSLQTAGVFEPLQTNTRQVSYVLVQLGIRKASGPDEIPNSALKCAEKSIETVSLLTRIFNACFSLAYFPSNWKVAKVCAIPKSAPSSNDPKQYRPISLLSCIGKVFEAIVLDQLKDHEEKEKIFIKQQFGFRSQHSTLQQILRITEKASIGFNKNLSTGLVLLDLEKAFDSVWHDGVIHKLLEAKYPPSLVSLIQSYLTDRKGFVSFKGCKSEAYDVLAGVPQGSLLSPHLFNIFVNDIPIPSECELAMYADDTALFCQVPWKNLKKAKKLLLASLSAVQDFFTSWKIKLNSKKTKFTILTKSTKMVNNTKTDAIRFGAEEFSWSPSVRYLGVQLDQKLTFKQHVDVALSKAKSLAFSTFYCLLKRGNKVREREKVAIYRSIIRPVLSYGCPIIFNCAKGHLKKFQTFQNSVLRMALNVKWDSFTKNTEIHQRARIPTIDEFFTKLVKNFYDNCNRHPSSLVSQLGNYNPQALEFRLKHRLPKRLN